jgi:uncharacterized protein (TIGR03382 family)
MRASAVLPLLLVAGTASASPMSVVGEVTATQSRWTADESRIITEATVRMPDGSEMVVSQLGGTVDGLTMRTFPGPELLAPGMRVALSAHEDMDLAQRNHIVVDSVKVMYAPPGFVRTGPTKAGHSLYWESGCVYVTPDADGTNSITGDREFQIITNVISTWNDATSDCSYMNIVQDSRSKKEVGKDKVNVIKFRDTSWCRPKIGDDAARCYSPAAAGLTTAVYVDDISSTRDGAIVDADIELNNVDFAITAAANQLAGCEADLANTLTHEIGHLLGLEHPCRASGDPARIDDQGKPVPQCGSTSDPKILESTMYNFQDCGEVKKQSLSSDDVNAVCSIYPKAEDPGTCEHVGASGGVCSASPGSSPMPLVLLLGMVFLMTRRRR